MNLPPIGTADLDAPLLADQTFAGIAMWRLWSGLLAVAGLAILIHLSTVNERDASVALTTPAAGVASEAPAAGTHNLPTPPTPPTSPAGLASASPAAVGAQHAKETR